MPRVNTVTRLAWARIKRAASRSCSSYQGHLRRDFLAGLLIVVPLAATVLILKWLFQSIDGILAPAVDAIFGRHIPGIGFGAIMVMIYLAGVAARNMFGWKAIQRGESLLEEVPMIREIYSTVKQVLESVMLPHEGAFKEVVLVEFPRAGMRTIGFVTNRVRDSSGKDLVNVYIPTTPNPTSGYLEIVPEDEVFHVDMPIDQAIKMVVSGGTVSPEVIRGVHRRKRARGVRADSSDLLQGSIPPEDLLAEPAESPAQLRSKRNQSRNACKVG